jgi:propanol-preferring alcohol dehydrogenase
LQKQLQEARIVEMDLDVNNLRAANDNSADIIINSKKQDPVKAVMEVTDKMGADAIIDFVNASKTVETDMQLLRRRVKVVLFGGQPRLNLVSMRTRAYRLVGSYTGRLSELIELISLAEKGMIKPIVSDKFKLDQATEALSKLKAGQIIGRGVINP